MSRAHRLVCVQCASQVYKNIDMCFQGDIEIIQDWKRHKSIDQLKKIVEEKGYSAVCVGSFGHAALKSFDYQLTKDQCKPSHGYTNELHIWFPSGAGAKPQKVDAPRLGLPSGFRFHDGFGEATRGDQIGHITSGGIENHCFKGDKMNWPLQWAATIGDVGAIESLVAHGYDPNVKMTDWFDSEPLGWAASFGQCKAIEALCAAGADPRRAANLAGETPLSDARREGHHQAIELINEYLSGKRSIGTSGHAQRSGIAGGCKGSAASAATSPTPSHGNPASNNALNTELNNVARNTDDTAKARALVAEGADLSSTNGPSWRHTPLHQAAYHGRYEMAKTLVELGAPLELHSNPCGRGETGIPLELARGGGHHKIAEMLEKAMAGGGNVGAPVYVAEAVVMGQAVDEASATAGAADQLPTLVEMVNKIKFELGIDGNVAEVVSKACAELGVSTKGNSLIEQAGECWKRLS